MQFLFQGFSQQGKTRIYRFQGVVARERPTQASRNIDFTLAVDMALLAQHHIAIQDGPALCLQILTGALTTPEDNTGRFASYAITLQDLSAFSSAKSAREESKMARRKPRRPFKPAASSQLRWPQVR
ncbi:MAG TPA: hypothetical protein VN610_06390 [Bryobacteraceae bacterium]|nr:hypothetical protein [Bryobacteraceae bacterium]